MTCPRCGAALPPGTVVCAACGPESATGGGAAAHGGAIPGRGAEPQPTLTSLPGDTPTRTHGAGSGPGGGGSSTGGARLAPGARLGTRYEIVAILGEGGMGTVYRAIDHELGRDVALKVIRSDMAAHAEVLERFKREILLSSKVTHRHVLRIHDLGEAGDLRFISMQYVAGTNLKEVLRREGRLPVERVASLARQIADALSAAHQAGVVHRDLKPQNILIDADGMAYIADFGISRSLDAGATMTETGAIIGTVDYMSPEQARGETPDQRGDIYALGVILYELLTGTLPFRADNPLSVMMRRVHEDAPSVRRADPGLPAWIAAIAARAMQRDPRDRYQSAADLLRDLDRRRAAMSWRRFRPAVAATLVILALAAVGVWALRGGPATSVPLAGPRASLVVLPFRNATGDPRYDWVRAALPELLRSDLLQARGLRLVDADRLREILDGLKLPENEEPRQEALQRVAALAGAESLLSASVLKAGQRFRIEAALSRAGPESMSRGEPIRIEGDGEEALFGMVDELTERIRQDLGVSRRLLESDRGVAALSTDSVEALRLYGEGIALSRSGRALDAVARLEEALGQDQDFAMARALLAETYAQLGEDTRAREQADRAARSLGTASPYEAAHIRAVAARLGGDPDAALKAYRGLAEVAPNDPQAFMELAAVQEEQGDLAGAQRSLRRVVELDPGHPSAHYVLGRVDFKTGETGEALKEFNTALSLYVDAGNDEGRAAVLNGLGNAQKLLGQPDEALRYYQESLAIRRRIGDRSGVDAGLNNIALLLLEKGRYDDAIRTVREAIAIGEEIGAAGRLAGSWMNLGDIEQAAGRPEAALAAYQESLRLVRAAGDESGLARALSSVGYINTVLGRYLEAYFFLKEALAKHRASGDRGELVRSLIDIGVVEQVQGRYDEALKYDLEGLSLARDTGNRAAVTILLMNLSNIHEDQGDYGAALKLLEEAGAEVDQLGDRTLTATRLAYLGSVRLGIGDLAGARESLDAGLMMARELDNRSLQAEVLTSQGALRLSGGDGKGAVETLRAAVTAAQTAREHRLLLLARLRLAEARGDDAGLQAIITEGTAAGLLQLRARAEVPRARIHLAAGRDGEALRHARAAIEAATPLRQSDLLFQARHLAARSLQRLGRESEAGEAAGAALDDLEALRRGLAPADLAKLLGRPQVVEFGQETAALFHKLKQNAMEGRLQGLLSP